MTDSSDRPSRGGDGGEGGDGGDGGDGGGGGGRRSRYWWLVGLAIAAGTVILLAPLASSDPDGLERVAGDQGFLGNARDALFSIIPDYTVPGINGNLSTILAGLIGVALVFGIMLLLGRVLARRKR
ncbi:MAG TPA: PDGLE domain-containing protein [Candidatus Limnocylindrales bacterium]|nr:PDGLE domain-containing protein [Candidatus Limnocylindrales bacterium]